MCSRESIANRLCIVMLALPAVSVQLNLWQVKNFSGPVFSHSYKWIETWFLTRSSSAVFWRAQLFKFWNYFVKHRKVDLDKSFILGNCINTFCSTILKLLYHFSLKRWRFLRHDHFVDYFFLIISMISTVTQPAFHHYI